MELTNTLAERKGRYGDFKDHAEVTQRLKNVCIESPMWEKLTPVMREGVDMIMHKLGRALCGDPTYADTWHDIAGYAKLVEERCEDA